MKPPLLFRSLLARPRRSPVAELGQSGRLALGVTLVLGLTAAGCAVDNKGLRGGGGAGGQSTGGSGPASTGGAPGAGTGGAVAPASGGQGSGGTTASGGSASGGAPGSGGQPASGSGGDSGGQAGAPPSGATGGTISSSGGEPGSGGAATGGRGTGGAGTGGLPHPGTGGAGTGGAGTGGAGTGGAGTGGAGTGGAPVPACSATTCPNGCCMGAMCITNRTDQRCGTGGVTCAACGACLQCGAAGTCTPQPTARWDVICGSAVIAPTRNGGVWDPMAPTGPLPDPFCRLTVDGETRGTTAIKMESLAPVWNQSVTGGSFGTVTTLTTSVLTAASPRWVLSVIDDDGTDDPICTVSNRLTAADLAAGTVTFANEQSCQSLTVKFVCAAP